MSKNVTYKLKPFRLLTGKDLHKKSVERELTTKWRPIFKMMEQCPLFNTPQHVDGSFVQSSFLRATEFLKSRAGYIWEKKDDRILSTWSVGTWSRMIQRGMIEKHGTAADKAVLQDAMARNQPHKEKRTSVVYGDARADGHEGRLNKTPRRLAIDQRREAAADAFGDAFGGVVPDT